MATSKGKYDDLPLANKGPLKVPLHGRLLLDNPFYNKGTCFTTQERLDFGLKGLLPTNIQHLDEQVERAYQQYSNQGDDLSKNTFMTSMAEQNTVLYYRLILDHIKEMFSIIYTPTEGDAIENYSRVFRRPDGCFLSIKHPDEVEERLSKFVREGEDDGGVDYIVVSDGEEILGIGDQGIGGILISVAKLALMTICAGLHPDRTLPVVLDVGTDNEKLLNDPLYLGHRIQRTRGEAYDDFVERFVKAAKKLYPKAYIHFEDFGLTNARRLLDRYRDQTAVFNDDIQGTGCVTLASIMAALSVAKVDLKDIRTVIFGAGTAGTGIAEQIQAAIATQAGKSKEEVVDQIWCVDKPGLLVDSMGDKLTIAQKPFARKSSEWEEKDTKSLQAIISEVKPHILIGTSTKPGAFTEDVVKEMAKHVERPIIFPLSNPTRLHEAKPEDLIKWTDGKALVATGSPFPPVKHNGKKVEVAECNNSVCFPGIGLGGVLCRTKLVTDKMLVAATEALAKEAPVFKDPSKGLCPDVDEARPVSVKIAAAVIRTAVEEGLAQTDNIPVENDDDLENWIKAQMWDPVYRPYQKV
ncbi:NAD-dependent malic enzyme, mitochondrial [Elasticomyces elasticus]|uniref:Malic enzyme n=1 Tax=Exophiala sideris TaxID=1016849 RepID=A0ABR0JKR3_9EURO|nr:NAD-dependent malic enzyme, mitochondrial [Elasticomyces elasticus]KAK5030223.1 NAD-dependent malic enzyme, mitochondrial [Exophiala sideris]KAK5035121.1 NAD-dependent malic enzyme, mitochondrial [Exophiala sideris]KAK5066044.1 NAD-dependent malic enzyme, mitochondrial [Exophiala sideris]KAK5178288.1 NAD-dependent malic enzyme, mitochondrial [Eurotiomycetes sp. CCFEE 6388]